MDRSGQLNAWELAKLCFSGRYEKAQVLKMLNGQGGVFAYLGTKDFRQVEELRNQGDETASAVFEALAYPAGQAGPGVRSHRPHRRRHLFPGLPAAAALPHLLSGPGDLQARRGGDGQPGLLPQRRPHRRAPAQGI